MIGGEWRQYSALIGQFPNAGVGLELTLLDWLQKYTFPTETGLADTEEARRVYTRSVGDTMSTGFFGSSKQHLEIIVE